MSLLEAESLSVMSVKDQDEAPTVTVGTAAGPPESGASPVAPPERRANTLRFDFSKKLRIRRAGEREVLLLTLVCALDMYTTIWWVLTGQAHEGNKLIAWTFSHNPVLFVLIKCGSCLPALLLAPYLAQRHPKLTIWLLRGILVAYIGLYLANVK